MTDLKGIEISDLLGLSQPLTKLIETVSAGVGKIYEPIHIKRMAKAKACEITKLSESINENIGLPIMYKNGEVNIDTTDYTELFHRASNRFIFQEVKKQQNIDAIFFEAYQEIEKKDIVNENAVDIDWINTFFDYESHISDTEMQKLWGKLLAEEVEEPGRFSVRTLDILRKLTHREAGLFSKISPYVLSCFGDSSKSFKDYFVFADDYSESDFTKKLGYDFSTMLSLAEAGLVQAMPFVSVGIEVPPGERGIFEGKKSFIEVCNKSAQKVLLRTGAYCLTAMAKELLPVVWKMNETEVPDWYMEECKKHLIEDNALQVRILEGNIHIKIIAKN